MMFINNIFSTRYNFPNERLGFWPRFTFDLSEAEFNEDDEQTPYFSQKNNQPILVNNWLGGSIDRRTFVTRWDGSTRGLYSQQFIYNFSRDNIFHQESSEFGIDFLEGLHADRDESLNRTNFCPGLSDFFEDLRDLFIDINYYEDNGVNFVLDIERYGVNYIHLISRDIDFDLPGIEENHQLVGPFSTEDKSCRDFSWLLEEF